MNWTTRDGRVLALTEMSDAHINNIIRMLDRRGLAHADVLLAAHFYMFGPLPSDAALDAVGHECEALFRQLAAVGLDFFEVLSCMRWLNVYGCLCAERARRRSAGAWTCSDPEHDAYDPARKSAIPYGITADGDLTLAGKGDSR